MSCEFLNQFSVSLDLTLCVWGFGIMLIGFNWNHVIILLLLYYNELTLMKLNHNLMRN